MQISVTVSDEIIRQAETRGLTVVDFVDLLIDKGLVAIKEPKAVSSAIDRIRALRADALGSGR